MVRPLYFIICIIFGIGAVFFYARALTGAGSVDESVRMEVRVYTSTPTPEPTPEPTSTPTQTPSGGGGGGGSASTPIPTPLLPTPAIVELKGVAYPYAVINILRDAQLIGEAKTDSNGLFSFTDSGLAGGDYNYAILAIDSEGRKSMLAYFMLSVAPRSVSNVTGIIVPPTVSANKNQLQPGEILEISGQAVPGAVITIKILPSDIVRQTLAQNDGRYFARIETACLPIGLYKIAVKEKLKEGGESVFSDIEKFGIGMPYEKKRFEIPKVGWDYQPDYNRDGRVNIIDVSIMLYWFKREIPRGFFLDLNGDGKVDIADFSVLAYYWTG